MVLPLSRRQSLPVSFQMNRLRIAWGVRYEIAKGISGAWSLTQSAEESSCLEGQGWHVFLTATNECVCVAGMYMLRIDLK